MHNCTVVFFDKSANEVLFSLDHSQGHAETCGCLGTTPMNPRLDAPTHCFNSFSWMLGASTTSLHANNHSRGPGHHHYQSRIKTRPLGYRNTGTVRRDMAYDAWNIYSWCLIDRSPRPMYGYCEETRLGKCLPTNLFLTPYGSKPLGYLWGYQIVHVVWQIYSWYPMDQSP